MSGAGEEKGLDLRHRPGAGRQTTLERRSPAYGQPAPELLSALALPATGTIYDLDAGRWPGMPIHRVHPSFLVTTYRTPQRSQIDGDMPAGATGVTTELISSSAHSGTHIDALSHITWDGKWFGGGVETEHLGDFGPTVEDAAAIPPLVCRGVMLDVAAVRGVSALPAGEAVTVDDLRAALDRQGVDLRRGDAVLIRTGYMSVWDAGDASRLEHYGAGPNLDAAAFLADSGAVVVGADTDDFEQVPSRDPESYLPAHVELLVRRGIYIIELMALDQLAEDGAYEFLFICLPLRIRGATGSMVRPIAIT